MISEEQLKQYGDMASDYRYDGSVFKPIVIDLIAEARRLQTLENLFFEKQKELSRVFTNLVETRIDIEQLERQRDWLADMIASMGKCVKDYNIESPCHEGDDCAECWRESARKVTESE